MFYGHLPEVHNVPKVTSHLISMLDRVVLFQVQMCTSYLDANNVDCKYDILLFLEEKVKTVREKFPLWWTDLHLTRSKVRPGLTYFVHRDLKL